MSPCSYHGDSSDTYLTPLSSLPNIPEAFEKAQMQNQEGATRSGINQEAQLSDDVPQQADQTNNTEYSKCLQEVQATCKERRDINVINSLFSKVKDGAGAPLVQSLTDSGFLSQTTSIHSETNVHESIALPSSDNRTKTSPVYMYVDINTVEEVQAMEQIERRKNRPVNPDKPRSVSMFIDLNTKDVSSAINQAQNIASSQQKQQTNSRSEQVETEVRLRRSSSYKIERPVGKMTSPEIKVGPCRHGIYMSPEQELQKQDSCNQVKAQKNKVDEDLLLPMSPIMRRKNQKPELSKQPAIQEVNASIKPQDVDSFTITRRTAKSESRIVAGITTTRPMDSQQEISSLAPSPPSDNSPEDNLIRGSNEALSSPPSVNNQDFSKNSLINIDGTRKSHPVIKTFHPPPESFVQTDYQVPSDFEEDTETIYSEISDLSSIGGLSTSTVTLHSSKKGSNGGRTPEEDRRHEYRVTGPCSKLGEDLLRMFMEEINTDVIVEVAGKEIKAHK